MNKSTIHFWRFSKVSCNHLIIWIIVISLVSLYTTYLVEPGGGVMYFG